MPKMTERSTPKSPRDAVGSTVYLTAGKIRQRADVISGGNFASSNDPRVHFGLGDTATVDDVEIRWPSETVEKIRTPAGDCYRDRSNRAKILAMPIEQIVQQLQAERDCLDAAIKALTTVSGSSPITRGRRTLSAAARRKISLAQKARWAKVKARKR
jgi:hypothetical protein